MDSNKRGIDRLDRGIDLRIDGGGNLGKKKETAKTMAGAVLANKFMAKENPGGDDASITKPPNRLVWRFSHAPSMVPLIAGCEIRLKSELSNRVQPETDPSEIPSAAHQLGLTEDPPDPEILSTCHRLPRCAKPPRSLRPPPDLACHLPQTRAPEPAVGAGTKLDRDGAKLDRDGAKLDFFC